MQQRRSFTEPGQRRPRAVVAVEIQRRIERICALASRKRPKVWFSSEVVSCWAVVLDAS
jgi:hypothetical protein